MSKKYPTEPQAWRRREAKRGPKYVGQPKVKTHVSIDAHIYLIARNTGNISAFLNEAAKIFISSKHFKKYVQEWSKAKEEREARYGEPKDDEAKDPS